MKFLIAKDGYPSVETEPKYQILADFLRGDVQADMDYTNELILLCNKILYRELPMWEGTGNSHTVTLKPDSVEIFNEYTERCLIIPSLSEFKSYLEKWRNLIVVKG